MSEEISIKQISKPRLTIVESIFDGEQDRGNLELQGLRPWLATLGNVVAAESESVTDELEALVESLSERCSDVEEGKSDWETAAKLSCRVAEGDGSELAALLAGFYLLKRRGYEAGQSPAKHWRLTRLLNVGSSALDFFIDDRRLRRMSIETLFYRLLKVAVRKGTVDGRGWTAEMPVRIDWDEATGTPLRRQMPEDPNSGQAVIDWLPSELLARGLTSLTLGSVIEESRKGRTHVIDDDFGEWIETMNANEARFVVGTLFMPARLGGWPRPEQERMLDAFAVARQIADDFVPEEAKIDTYRRHLQQLDELRRIADDLSATFEVTDGSSSWRGRWAVTISPVRRDRNGKDGYFALEAGFYFEEPKPEVGKWSPEQKRSFKTSLLEIADAADDQSFGIFAEVLDQVVERLNIAPATLIDSPVISPSPLWKQLPQAGEEIRRALRESDLQILTKAFREWTTPYIATT